MCGQSVHVRSSRHVAFNRAAFDVDVITGILESTVGPTLVDPRPAGAPAVARLGERGRGHQQGRGPRAWGPQSTPMNSGHPWRGYVDVVAKG